tara:strand:- start:21 stop:221 length:201 start_codon:yes stop_codon:yes gene_type:complete
MEFANNTEFVLFVIMVGLIGAVAYMVGSSMLQARNDRHRQTARDLREIKTKLSLIESKLKNQVSSY